MGDNETLRVLGSPEVRNAIILNEIGVLIHGLGKLSAEYVSTGQSFPHHLFLRRLTRGQDPYLGSDVAPQSAAIRALSARMSGDGDSPVVEDQLRRTMRLAPSVSWSSGRYSSLEAEAILDEARSELLPRDRASYQRVAGLVRRVWSGLDWQERQERAIEGIQPPFIAVGEVLESLDLLPSVADLVEMQGRTWHPVELVPPEVRLLRTIQSHLDPPLNPRCVQGEDGLYEVRKLFCEVLANQLLEVNNIRKDGPGDLGSWFWTGRLYPRSEGAVAALRSFDEGMPLNDAEREAVAWLGMRGIAEWAYSKVLLGKAGGRTRTSLWEHCRWLCALHKSGLAQALIEGRWREGARPSWRALRVVLRRPARDDLLAIRQLIEVEYPLGNALHSGESEIEFTFPAVARDTARSLLEALEAEVVRLLGSDTSVELSLTPLRGLGRRRSRAGAPSKPW